MDRRRVLIIGHTYAAKVNRLKFALMAKDGRFEFLLVTPRKWRNYLTMTDNWGIAAANGIRTIFADVWLGWHPALYVVPKLGRIIRQFKPDLIHCEQEPICLVSLQAVLLSRETPIVFFSWENLNRLDFLYRLFAPIRRLCYRKSKFMTAGSRGAAAVIRGHGYRKSIYITPMLGVSEDLFHPGLRRSAAPDEFVIGYLGRLVPEKGVLTLLRAVKGLDREPHWRLVLVGGGPLRSDYQRLVKEWGIEDRVSFQAAVPHEMIPQFLNSFDVLVLPSETAATWKEQFGHVLIEAMACGVPVIGSSSGEIPEVVNRAGLIFAEGVAEELRDRLARLSKDPRLQERLRQAGLRRVQERYTDARIAANMIALYEIALGLSRQTGSTLESYPA